MTKVAIAEEVAAQIRSSEGPIELVDASGQTIGIVHCTKSLQTIH